MIWNRRGFLTMCTAVGASVLGVLGPRIPAEDVDVWAMTDEELDQYYDKIQRQFLDGFEYEVFEDPMEPPGWNDEDLRS